MADDTTTAVIEAPAIEVPEAPSEPEAYTREDLGKMSFREFVKLHPEADTHLASEGDAIAQRELERVMPELRAQIEETVKRENEDRWLEHLRGRITGNDSKLAYYEAVEQVQQARAERGQKAMERDDLETRYISRQKVNAQKWLDKLNAVDPEYGVQLQNRKWAPGAEGVDDYIEAVRERLVDHGIKTGISGKEKLIEETAKKDALSGVERESPEISAATGSGRSREDWGWYQSQPLETRLAIKKDTARYDRIVATLNK